MAAIDRSVDEDDDSTLDTTTTTIIISSFSFIFFRPNEPHERVAVPRVRVQGRGERAAAERADAVDDGGHEEQPLEIRTAIVGGGRRARAVPPSLSEVLVQRQ